MSPGPMLGLGRLVLGLLGVAGGMLNTSGFLAFALMMNPDAPRWLLAFVLVTGTLGVMYSIREVYRSDPADMARELRATRRALTEARGALFSAAEEFRRRNLGIEEDMMLQAVTDVENTLVAEYCRERVSR